MTPPPTTSTEAVAPDEAAAPTHTVAAIGDSDDLDGFRLVGVTVTAVQTPSAALAAWDALSERVGLVILSPSAASALGPRLSERPEVMTVTTP